MDKIFDLIIIGSGPAGLVAGIYGSRANMDFIIIEKNPISGGQIINTYEVDNYPGIPGISGYDLAVRFREHCDRLGVNFVTGDVTQYDVEDDIKTVTTDAGISYKAKTLLIATGAVYRKLGVEGETQYSGMGVSYCATCDGAFFRNKDVAVVGGGDVAVEDAIFLSKICNKVYLVHRRDELRAAKTSVAKLQSLDNVEILWDNVVEEISGSDTVEHIQISNVKTNEKRILDISGVFIAVGNLPSSPEFKNLFETDVTGYIVADESCKTNVDGIFAAGDIRTKELRQIITAAADGANAITSIERYLNRIL